MICGGGIVAIVFWSLLLRAAYAELSSGCTRVPSTKGNIPSHLEPAYRRSSATSGLSSRSQPP